MKKVLLTLSIIMITFCLILSSTYKTETKADTIDSSNVYQYLGKGYSTLNGKGIYEAGAYSNFSIIDMSKLEKGTDYSYQIESESLAFGNNSSKKSEISEMISSEFFTDVEGGLSVSGISANLGVQFNTSAASKLSTISYEEYSYYFMRVKKLIVSYSDAVINNISNYLSDSFLDAVLKVKTEDDALNLFKSYNTHILTGYELGGLMLLTNYYATSDITSDREINDSFSTQVEAGMASKFNVNADLSFNNAYESKDNDSTHVNTYKTYFSGGKTFPSLTIDQIFSTIDSDSTVCGFNYQTWTDSLNDYNSLSVVDIPNSNKMIAIWNLLPDDAKYQRAKDLLVKAYVSKCKSSYQDYITQYPDIEVKTEVMNKTTSESPIVKINGYNYLCDTAKENEQIATYITYDENSNNRITNNSLIALDYNVSEFADSEIEWKLSSSLYDDYVTIVDSRNGVFRINQNANNIDKLIFECYIDGTKVTSITFKLAVNSFYGGNGTSDSPYLIGTVDQLKLLSKQEYYAGNYYFELINDLDLSGQSITIGTKDSPFNGNFNGNNHILSNLTLDNGQINGESIGLFIANKGTIKNLNITKFACNITDTGTVLTKNAGLLVGINEREGQLSDIYITNSKLMIECSTQTNDSSLVSAYIGGIVGESQGKLTRLSISDSSVYACYEKENDEKVAVGGIVGNIRSTEKNSYLEVKNVQIFAECGRGSSVGDNHVIAIAGGICGELELGVLSKCSVSQENSTVKYTFATSFTTLKKLYNNNINFIFNKNKGFITSVIDANAGLSTYDNRFVSSGGLIGYCGNGTIEDSIVFAKNIYAMDYVTETLKSNTSRFKRGIICGKTTSLTIKNCKAVMNKDTDSNDLNIYGDVAQSNDVTISTEGYKNFVDDYYELNSDGDFVELKGTKAVSVYIDLSKATSVFSKGTYFTPGQITVQVLDSSGNTYSTSYYIVDISEYNKDAVSNNNKITIMYGSTSKSYNVKVVDEKIYDIKIEQKSGVDIDYYINDTFNPDDYTLTLVYDNGREECITKDDVTWSDLVLSEENNVITLAYSYNFDGKQVYFTKNYYVDAKTRKVSGIMINTNLSQDGEVVESVTKDDIKVTVLYEDGTSSALSSEQYDLIIPKLVGGTNTCYVMYNALYSKEFEVLGAGSYQITFKNEDGTILSQKEYHYNDVVIEPDVPQKASTDVYQYVFKSWDKEVTKVTEDATYVATYTEEYINYTIKFVDYNDVVILSKTYHYGDTITIPEDPTRASDGQYSYVFEGWSEPVSTTAVKDVTYQATYQAIALSNQGCNNKATSIITLMISLTFAVSLIYLKKK